MSWAFELDNIAVNDLPALAGSNPNGPTDEGGKAWLRVLAATIAAEARSQGIHVLASISFSGASTVESSESGLVNPNVTVGLSWAPA